MTDLCGTARLGGQVCPREVLLHVQRVSCDDGRLDPVQDRDSCSARNTSGYPRSGVGKLSTGLSGWGYSLVSGST